MDSSNWCSGLITYCVFTVIFICYLTKIIRFDGNNILFAITTNYKYVHDRNYLFPEWTYFNLNTADQYFNDYELSTMVEPQCRQKSAIKLFNSSEYEYDDICCIGRSRIWNRKCVNGTNYFQKLKYPNDRNAFNMVDIFNLLPNHSTIAILGDSVQHQFVEGLLCDLWRNSNNEIIEIAANTETKAFYNKLYAKYHNKNAYANHYVLHNLEFHTFINTTSFHQISMLYLKTYRINKELFVDNDQFCNFGDFYIINYGLNYIEKESLVWNDEIGSFLLNELIPYCIALNFKKFNKSKIFIWRETTSQHFKRIGGYYQDIYDTVTGKEHDMIWKYNAKWEDIKLDFRFMHNSFQCVPQSFYNKSFEINFWRNRLQKTMQQNKYLNLSFVYPNEQIYGKSWNSLYFIPFKEITDPLWFLHRLECTHYCHSPYLWEFILDEVFRIIQHNTQ